MDNISISLSEGGHNREVSEVRVDGVIDTLTATELEQVIDSLLRRGRFKIVMDLAGVDYISSAGWGIFISHIKDVRANEGDIKLANMVPDVYEIFELLEFDKVLHVYTSVGEAVETFVAGAPGEGKKKSLRHPSDGA
jgi:anti-sigma B factor antagonist